MSLFHTQRGSQLSLTQNRTAVNLYRSSGGRTDYMVAQDSGGLINNPGNAARGYRFLADGAQGSSPGTKLYVGND